MEEKRSLRNEKLKANRASEIEEQRKARLRIRCEKEMEDHEKHHLAILKRLQRGDENELESDWRQLPNGSGDGRRKKSKCVEDGSYQAAQVDRGDGRRKKSKTEEDGSYHTVQVNPLLCLKTPKIRGMTSLAQ